MYAFQVTAYQNLQETSVHIQETLTCFTKHVLFQVHISHFKAISQIKQNEDRFVKLRRREQLDYQCYRAL